jgi:hypothetical protein
MHQEEIRMNKELLKEINKMKKDNTLRGSSPSRHDTNIDEIAGQINDDKFF